MKIKCRILSVTNDRMWVTHKLTFLEAKKSHVLAFSKLVYSSLTRAVKLNDIFSEITPSGTKSVFISWIIYPNRFALDL